MAEHLEGGGGNKYFFLVFRWRFQNFKQLLQNQKPKLIASFFSSNNHSLDLYLPKSLSPLNFDLNTLWYPDILTDPQSPLQEILDSLKTRRGRPR